MWAWMVVCLYMLVLWWTGDLSRVNPALAQSKLGLAPVPLQPCKGWAATGSEWMNENESNDVNNVIVVKPAKVEGVNIFLIDAGGLLWFSGDHFVCYIMACTSVFSLSEEGPWPETSHVVVIQISAVGAICDVQTLFSLTLIHKRSFTICLPHLHQFFSFIILLTKTPT